MDNLEQYLAPDGTYVSPRNGKRYKTLKAFKSHWHYSGHVKPDTLRSRLYNVNCEYCSKSVVVTNIRKHQRSCYLNPKNIRTCIICSNPIKNYKTSKGTCSRSCSNKHFRSGKANGNWNDDRYTTTCFLYHKKECVVCGENKIVAVHHLDENRDNNNPSNLIPLCPTHHQYFHSRHRHEVEHIINQYLLKWKQQNGV